jgi:hypothetical protein
MFDYYDNSKVEFINRIDFFINYNISMSITEQINDIIINYPESETFTIKRSELLELLEHKKQLDSLSESHPELKKSYDEIISLIKLSSIK